MNTGPSSSAMSGMAPTTTASAPMSTSTAMSMSMGSPGACKISMLWNWHVVDACFISSTWRITSKGMFAGSCIGVICLVMSLEFLRRLQRSYEQRIIRNSKYQHVQSSGDLSETGSTHHRSPGDSAPKVATDHGTFVRSSLERLQGRRSLRQYRPSVLQQAIRAGLHMVQFGVAYFIMLLAMYYNGYIIICILIGAFIGSFIFSWDQLSSSHDDATEVTGCCG